LCETLTLRKAVVNKWGQREGQRPKDERIEVDSIEEQKIVIDVLVSKEGRPKERDKKGEQNIAPRLLLPKIQYAQTDKA